MSNASRAEVQAQFEQLVKAFNTNDEHMMWRCFVWPYTEIQGNDLTLRYAPVSSLATLKASTNWFYSQIATLDIHATAQTAYVIANIVRLDSIKHVIGEVSTLYVYKKISGEWKILLISES